MQKIMPFFILTCLSLSSWAQMQNTQKPDNTPQVNYKFSLRTLDEFFPGKKLADVESKYKKTTTLLKKDKKIYRTYIEHDRYKFPVFFIIKNEVISSFFARMPTFFLHDLFHKDLIKKYGKQDEFTKAHLSALYQWKNENGFHLTYKAQCTITCFPAYLTVKKSGDKVDLLSEF